MSTNYLTWRMHTLLETTKVALMNLKNYRFVDKYFCSLSIWQNRIHAKPIFPLKPFFEIRIHIKSAFFALQWTWSRGFWGPYGKVWALRFIRVIEMKNIFKSWLFRKNLALKNYKKFFQIAAHGSWFSCWEECVHVQGVFGFEKVWSCSRRSWK